MILLNLMITRHGETDWNKYEKAQGVSNIPLNQTGIRQAYCLKNKLVPESIDLVICSPLKRARTTAEIAIGDRGIPIIEDDRLIERNFGTLEGKPYSGIDFEKVWAPENNFAYCASLGVEAVPTLFSRVYDFIAEAEHVYKGKNILVVSHGCVSIAITHFYGKRSITYRPLPEFLDNCELKKFF